RAYDSERRRRGTSLFSPTQHSLKTQLFDLLARMNIARQSNRPIHPQSYGFALFNVGFSPEAGAGTSACFPFNGAATGVAASVGDDVGIPPSVYGFLTSASTTSCAPPVLSFVCRALLYSFSARSLCPKISKIFPRYRWLQTSVHFSEGSGTVASASRNAFADA